MPEDLTICNELPAPEHHYDIIAHQVAKAIQTSPSRVEQAIRHAIEAARDRGDLDALQRFFGYTVSNTKEKPTNSDSSP